jgi:hypothetical protein
MLIAVAVVVSMLGVLVDTSYTLKAFNLIYPQALGKSAVQPYSRTATQPHSHTATQPHSHTATQPHSHTATQLQI